MATGLGVWLGSAYSFSGEVTIASTGGTLPCMYGTVASLFSPLLYSLVVTYIRPDNYNWDDFKEQKLAIESDESTDQVDNSQRIDKTTADSTTTESITTETPSDKTQRRWTKYALWWSVATFLGHWVLWPLPMYAAKYIFRKEVCSRLSYAFLFIHLLIDFLLVLYRMDGGVSDLALVDTSCSWLLSDLGWPSPDSDSCA
jgi:hypothetical protein